MDLFDNLASYGLTVKVLQILIFVGIAVYIIGLYWRYIVMGAGILFCVAVFAMSNKTDDTVKQEVVKQQQKEEVVVNVEPPPPVAEVKPKSDMEMFIEDCQLQTKYTEAQCKALWNEHKDEIEAVKYRGKTKKQNMYKVKYGT